MREALPILSREAGSWIPHSTMPPNIPSFHYSIAFPSIFPVFHYSGDEPCLQPRGLSLSKAAPPTSNPMLYAPCPMPYALCPMHNAQCTMLLFNGPRTNKKTPGLQRPRACHRQIFSNDRYSSLSSTPSITRESATSSHRYFTSRSIMSYSWRRLFMIWSRQL